MPRERWEGLFLLSWIQKMDCVVGLWGKKKVDKSITFFQLCFIRKRNGSPTGCQVSVPCLCWPLQAEVKPLKQILSDSFLLMKGSAAYAVSPQHSSLLVASRRCAGDVLSPVFCTGLDGRSVCTSGSGKLVGWRIPWWIWHLDSSCSWPKGLKAY